MNKPHKHCELIKAWADGAEIQRRKYASNEWVDTDPHWNEDEEYRIKPRTVKRDGWLNIYKYSDVIKPGSDIHDTEAEARHRALGLPIATVKVEWEEEEG